MQMVRERDCLTLLYQLRHRSVLDLRTVLTSIWLQEARRVPRPLLLDRNDGLGDGPVGLQRVFQPSVVFFDDRWARVQRDVLQRPRPLESHCAA